MKQINEVGIELERLSVIPVTLISIKCICCKQIKIQKQNKYDVPQYYCVKNLKLFLPDSKSGGSLHTYCHPCYCHPCYSPTIAEMMRYVKYKRWLCSTIYIFFN